MNDFASRGSRRLVAVATALWLLPGWGCGEPSGGTASGGDVASDAGDPGDSGAGDAVSPDGASDPGGDPGTGDVGPPDGRADDAGDAGGELPGGDGGGDVDTGPDVDRCVDVLCTPSGPCFEARCDPATGDCGEVAIAGCCGNGEVEAGETCDDGDGALCDGCEGCQRRGNLALAGGGSRACTGGNDNLGLTSWTVETWVRVDALPSPAAGHAILGRASGSAATDRVTMALGVHAASEAFASSSDPALRFSARYEDATDVDVWVLSEAVVEAGRWYHLAFVVDGAAVSRLYVDGRLEGEKGPLGVPDTPAASFCVGAYHDGIDAITGRVDEVRISATARYTAEFQPPRRLEPDGSTLSLWRFDRDESPLSNVLGGGRALVPEGPSVEADDCFGVGDDAIVCGDGLRAPWEACDDGNSEAADGCSPGCLLERSGWSARTPDTSPPARRSHAMAYDAARRQAVLFGGTIDDDPAKPTVGDTWIYDGDTWRAGVTDGDVAPPARRGHVMAWDAVTERVVMFGGVGIGGVSLDDTWAWDGERWFDVSPVSGPPSRHGAVAVTDPDRQRVVLFGGEGEDGQDRADVWAWDGVSWTGLSLGGTPGKRRYPAAAWDLRGARMLLFGGYTGGFLEDTWQLAVNAWSPVFSDQRPEARYQAAFGYDARRQVFVVTGGNGTDGDQGSTWELTGSRWTARDDAVSPAPRRNAAMVWFPPAHGLLLFGGLDGATLKTWRDTWVLGPVAF